MDYSNVVDLISKLHHVPNMDKEYILYYDETNNPRVFRLTENGFNYDEKAYFILGGIAFERTNIPKEEDIEVLLKKLKLQHNLSEIKFKHIKQNANSFIDLISKNRVKELISWLHENNYWIHYSFRDNFYYSIVDIIDSLPETGFGGLEFNRDIKNSLFQYIEADKEWFVQFLKYYEYPNVKNHREFINQLLIWIDNINPNGFDFNIEYIRQALKSKKEDVLTLLTDNLTDILIPNFSDIYANSIYTYYKSEHIFDEELEIQKIIDDNPIEVFGKKVSYEFINSKNIIFIQISDLVVGVLRMWMTYLEKHTITEMKEIFLSLSMAQKQTIIEFQDILNNSLVESFGFKHGSGSNVFEQKIAYFLEYKF
ncbi:DUF3800 domain-containing protein [Lactococcus garvieae]|uniref:DUF3800 domain-containing protein n=1 Tax=Lactococcus garvieae TaxID=1363 RepID=UPI0038543CD3